MVALNVQPEGSVLRRAKIVCTIGPATCEPEQIRALINAGMDVARLNLSHGTQAWHRSVYQSIRDISEATGQPVAVLADLQGPKIRLGRFAKGRPVKLKKGTTFTLCADDVMGTAQRASTSLKTLPADARPGDVILVDDGKVTLRVVSVSGGDVVTHVEVGGKVSDHKGINLPGATLSVPALTKKDEADLRFALELGVDWIALSFVRRPEDYDAVKAVMEQVGVNRPVLAKIEKPQAVGCLPELVEAFDGIMVARGDLGVELPLENVPLVQKTAIDLARVHAKPVIVATQMLESMVSSARPTRAEASDCANATLDGADALMLSGETSIGIYPIEAVRTMARIIAATEKSGQERMTPLADLLTTRSGIVAQSAAGMADELDAVSLVAMTESGESARCLARLRCKIPLIALTPNQPVRRQLALQWGVRAYLVRSLASTDEMVDLADEALLSNGLARKGQSVVLVSGAPMGKSGTTNQILVHQIGEQDS